MVCKCINRDKKTVHCLCSTEAVPSLSSNHQGWKEGQGEEEGEEGQGGEEAAASLCAHWTASSILT